MNIKDILRDPRAALISHWGSLEACKSCDKIIGLAEQSNALNKQIKVTKQEKQEISSQFKHVKAEPLKVSELKARMQEISSALQKLETDKKNIENELFDFFDTSQKTSEPIPSLPPRFNPPDDVQTDNRDLNFEIVCASNTDELAWDEYVNKHPKATPYQLFGWQKVIREVFGHTGTYLIAKDKKNNTIVGALPTVTLSSKIFGTFSISMPYFNYGGPIANNTHIAHALVQRAGELAKDQGCSYSEFRTCDPGYPLPSESRKASMILALPQDQNTLDSNLGAKLRAQINLGKKYKTEIAFGKLDLLDDYYRVFSLNMRDLGTPVYSKKFFRSILTAFPKSCTVVVVKLEGKPVSAAFLFGYKDLLEIPWASTIKKANKLNMNMLMYRAILGFAIDNKYQYFDFGRSTLDAGTYRFKKQWGAKPVQHYWYYDLAASGSTPKLNPDNPKYKLAISCWKKLPLFIANFIGPFIVKNIP